MGDEGGAYLDIFNIFGGLLFKIYNDEMAPNGKTKEPFWLGGAAASMAVCFTHPLDQTKYRMQVTKSQTTMLKAMYRSASRDGIFSLWAGLSASIVRQSTYSTARFGGHTFLTEKLLAFTGEKKLSVMSNIVCAGASGGLAGIIGNPAEVVLVRMCADGAKPVGQRFMYSNVFEAFIRTAREEGIQAFGKGITANIARSVLMNVSQIATYTSAKQYLMGSLGLADDVRTHAVSSLLAGTMATTLCAPADVLKSRLQSSAGQSGLIGVLQLGIREEGPRFLMKGWLPAWLRLTPHTILTFVFMEQLRRLTTIGLPWLKVNEAKEAVLR